MRIGRLTMHLRDIALEHDPEEGDTIESINAYLRENKEHYKEFYQISDEIVDKNADIPETADISSEVTAAEPPKAKRGRKPKNQPEAVTAVAPPPLAVPVDTTPNAGGIPAFLDRNAPAAPVPEAPAAPVAVAPPPPPVPAPAAPPPVGTLAPKVVAELHRRGDGAVDGGAALVAWLAKAGMCVPGATFEEACDCVSFLTDDKLGPVAQGLGVA